MARLLSRFIGLISLTAALTYFIYDGARSFMNQTVQISSVGSIWENIPKSWLAWLQPVIDRLGDIWHGDIQPYFLKQPVWLVLAIVGAVLIWAKKKSALALGGAKRFTTGSAISRKQWPS